jgi:asparagine synthase (glutamine-hydrolysing)
MCGIFSLLNNSGRHNDTFINEQFMKGQCRGPEHSELTKINDNTTLGFHRLAINGLNNESNQPINIQNITLICNGEIYNYKELYNLMGIKPATDSDCEVIIHLYLKYGIEHTLYMIDGVFAFILFDKNSNKIFAARDPYGVRPLYILKQYFSVKYYNSNNIYLYGFASEIKMLHELYCNTNYLIEHFKPGTYSIYSITSKHWKLEAEYIKYQWGILLQGMPQSHQPSCNENFPFNEANLSPLNGANLSPLNGGLWGLAPILINAIKKRVLVTERPIACLLSGGLDSSLVTALVTEIHKQNSNIPLETYSIGLEGSEDIKYARIVADYLGTKHTEVILTEYEFVNAIPEVIYKIESYDTTSVRASIGNYLLGKYISENSSAKVIFNGDGSDELCGGYLYMSEAPDSIEFDKECRRLLKDIHIFDVLRSDKSISSNGLEPRTPFLDKSWVQHYLSIHPEIRFHKKQGKMEKYLLREAFSKEYYLNSEGKQLLPDEILWRRKEAFSDGVSKKTRSLFTIIQEYCQIQITEPIPENSTAEKEYYKKIFNLHYKSAKNVVPYLWMPKYIEATDASARTLSTYTL